MRLFPVIFALTLAAQDTAPRDIDPIMKAARAAYLKGDYAAAQKSLEEAWAVVEMGPPKDPTRYTMLKQLSAVLTAQGDYAGAQKFVELAINWRETAVGRDDPKIPDELIELATLCELQKNFERALTILNSVLVMHMRAAGSLESQLVADDYSRIALVYMGDNKPDRAAGALTTAIGIREKILGPDHPGLLPELDRLAAALIPMREYERAEATFRRALLMRERLVGRFHADLIPTVEGLAYALFGQKKYDEAEVLYNRLLALWVQSAGKDHPMVSLTLDKISVFYRTQKKWEEGTSAAQKGIALRSLFLANGLAQEATALQGHGDKKEAERLYREALEALDPSRAEHDELRKQLEGIVASLEPPKKLVPPKKKAVGTGK